MPEKRKSQYSDAGSEVGVYSQRQADANSKAGYIPVMKRPGEEREGDPRTMLRAARNEELQASRADTPEEAGEIARRSVEYRGEAMRNKFGRFR